MLNMEGTTDANVQYFLSHYTPQRELPLPIRELIRCRKFGWSIGHIGVNNRLQQFITDYENMHYDGEVSRDNITICVGDALRQPNEYPVVHQVNCMGIGKSGFAKQCFGEYKKTYSKYQEVCDAYKKYPAELLGTALFCREKGRKEIINIFTQMGYNRGNRRDVQTDYVALYNALAIVNEKRNGQTLVMPYKIGADRGGGDWNVISEIIHLACYDCKILLVRLPH